MLRRSLVVLVFLAVGAAWWWGQAHPAVKPLVLWIAEEDGPLLQSGAPRPAAIPAFSAGTLRLSGLPHPGSADVWAVHTVFAMGFPLGATVRPLTAGSAAQLARRLVFDGAEDRVTVAEDRRLLPEPFVLKRIRGDEIEVLIAAETVRLPPGAGWRGVWVWQHGGAVKVPRAAEAQALAQAVREGRAFTVLKVANRGRLTAVVAGRP